MTTAALSSGNLIIGVDKSGKPVGQVDSSDEALLMLTNIRDEGRILDRPSMVVSRAIFQGQPVIQIEVSASRTPPVRFDNVVWVRPGPGTLCMNAIMHRNYESSYAPVRVAWFDDRIEVTNPGGPFGQVRPDNFDRVNDYRNPSLAAAMKSLGYVNQFGRGIGRVRASLRRNGNPEPEFVVDDASWTVTLWSAT